MENPTLTERQSFWLSHYKRCLEEKIPFEHYCKKHNLSATAFGHARKVLARLGVIKAPKSRKRCKAKPGFAAVKTPSERVAADRPMAQLQLPGNIRIQIPVAALEKLLPALLIGGRND